MRMNINFFRLLAVIVLLLQLSITSFAHAEDTPIEIPQIPPGATNEQLAELKKTYEALSAALTAQKAAQDALKDTQPADATTQVDAEEKAALATAKAKAELEKQIADLNKATLEAEKAALAVKYGGIPESYKGDITLQTGAGKGETLLLATKALNTVSLIAAGEIKKLDRDLIIVSMDNIPNFQNLVVFESQKAIFTAEYQTRVRNDVRDFGGAQPQSLAAAGLALEAFNKVLGFFKTDFNVANVEITAETGMLITSLAGYLNAPASARSVYIPSLHQPQMFNEANQIKSLISASAAQLDEANVRLGQFQERLRVVQSNITKLKATADDPKSTTAEKEAAKASIENASPIAEKLNGAVKGWGEFASGVQEWLKSLRTPNDKGIVPIFEIMKQSATKEQYGITNGNQVGIVGVKLNNLVGSNYTKKNIVSSLGGMPFFMAAGAVASFTVFDGKTGKVLMSSVIPFHGGYVSASKIQETVNGDPHTTKAPTLNHLKK